MPGLAIEYIPYVSLNPLSRRTRELIARNREILNDDGFTSPRIIIPFLNRTAVIPIQGTIQDQQNATESIVKDRTQILVPLIDQKTIEIAKVLAKQVKDRLNGTQRIDFVDFLDLYRACGGVDDQELIVLTAHFCLKKHDPANLGLARMPEKIVDRESEGREQRASALMKYFYSLPGSPKTAAEVESFGNWVTKLEEAGLSILKKYGFSIRELIFLSLTDLISGVNPDVRPWKIVSKGMWEGEEGKKSIIQLARYLVETKLKLVDEEGKPSVSKIREYDGFATEFMEEGGQCLRLSGLKTSDVLELAYPDMFGYDKLRTSDFIQAGKWGGSDKEKKIREVFALSLLNAGLGKRGSYVSSEDYKLEFTRTELLAWRDNYFEDKTWKDFISRYHLNYVFKNVAENKMERAFEILLGEKYNPKTGYFGNTGLNINDFSVVEAQKNSTPLRLLERFSYNAEEVSLCRETDLKLSLDKLPSIRGTCLEPIIYNDSKGHSSSKHEAFLTAYLLQGYIQARQIDLPLFEALISLKEGIDKSYLFTDEQLRDLLVILRDDVLPQLNGVTAKPIKNLKYAITDVLECQKRNPRSVLLRAFEINKDSNLEFKDRNTRLQFLNFVLEHILEVASEEIEQYCLPSDLPYYETVVCDTSNKACDILPKEKGAPVSITPEMEDKEADDTDSKKEASFLYADDPLAAWGVEVRRVHRRLEPDEEKARAKEGDFDPIVHSQLPQVIELAGRAYERAQLKGRHDVDLLDLVQDGNAALIKKAREFDPTRGTRVSTSVYLSISKAVEKAACDSRMVKIPQNVLDSIPIYLKARDILLKDQLDDLEPSTEVLFKKMEKVRRERSRGRVTQKLFEKKGGREPTEDEVNTALDTIEENRRAKNYENARRWLIKCGHKEPSDIEIRKRVAKAQEQRINYIRAALKISPTLASLDEALEGRKGDSEETHTILLEDTRTLTPEEIVANSDEEVNKGRKPLLRLLEDLLTTDQFDVVVVRLGLDGKGRKTGDGLLEELNERRKVTQLQAQTYLDQAMEILNQDDKGKELLRYLNKTDTKCSLKAISQLEAWVVEAGLTSDHYKAFTLYFGLDGHGQKSISKVANKFNSDRKTQITTEDVQRMIEQVVEVLNLNVERELLSSLKQGDIRQMLDTIPSVRRLFINEQYEAFIMHYGLDGKGSKTVEEIACKMTKDRTFKDHQAIYQTYDRAIETLQRYAQESDENAELLSELIAS